MRLAVLASGSGTILDAILSAGITVEVAVVDRPCPAVDVAARHGTDVVLVERESFGPDFDRDEYTMRVTAALEGAGIELVAMAGFGTVLGQAIQDVYGGRIVNTHPSLLPAFPGWHAVEEAVAYGVKVTGCTVHVATLEVDAGPILAQEAVVVEATDTVTTLHERIKTVERRLYPATLQAILRRGSVT
ncbi:MAG: phosphoribosylglycinamide formyltransferase [Acidimicrobiia bacterium]|nr:phosphoribosylglycinamide formyltransferase [Acidimicrobiia bacterium]